VAFQCGSWAVSIYIDWLACGAAALPLVHGHDPTLETVPSTAGRKILCSKIINLNSFTLNFLIFTDTSLVSPFEN
jgi:hypothetical protein